MSEENGRYYVTDLKSGRKFCVEPIGNDHAADWVILIPQLKKLKVIMVKSIEVV